MWKPKQVKFSRHNTEEEAVAHTTAPHIHTHTHTHTRLQLSSDQCVHAGKFPHNNAKFPISEIRKRKAN